MHPTPATEVLDPRREANRRNAALSTGPATREGKRRSSLNALRHGLTGQVVVLPSEDLENYQRHCAQYHAELKPEGLLETKAVQTVADTHWRLDRIRAMENNIFALAIEERDPMSSDPVISTALAQAASLEKNAALLTRLSLYEQRLNRTLVQALTQLKELQKQRSEAAERALKEAAKIRNLKDELQEEWQPEENGFEFSSTQLEAWMNRGDLVKQAAYFDFWGRLRDRGDAPAALDSQE